MLRGCSVVFLLLSSHRRAGACYHAAPLQYRAAGDDARLRRGCGTSTAFAGNHTALHQQFVCAAFRTYGYYALALCLHRHATPCLLPRLPVAAVMNCGRRTYGCRSAALMCRWLSAFVLCVAFFQCRTMGVRMLPEQHRTIPGQNSLSVRVSFQRDRALLCLICACRVWHRKPYSTTFYPSRRTRRCVLLPHHLPTCLLVLVARLLYLRLFCMPCSLPAHTEGEQRLQFRPLRTFIVVCACGISQHLKFASFA